MQAIIKPARRAILKTFDKPATSSRPLVGDFRRLNFESLEQRLYLAADLDDAAADTANLMQFVTANAVEERKTVDLSLTATKPDGSPLTNLHAGDDFVLHVWAQDRRSEPKGVFATYLNINWNSELAVTTGGIKHADRFFNGPSGDLSHSGSIREAGGFGGPAQSYGGRFEVFSVPMRATGDGDLSFVASSAASSPAHDMLVYGLDGAIDPLEVKYGELYLPIAERSPSDPSEDAGKGTITPSDPVASPNPPTPAINPPPLELPPDARGKTVGIAITVTAPDGTPLQNPRVGDDFILHAWVKDARQVPSGVLAAYLNVNWDANLAVPTGPLSYGERYVHLREATENTIQPGLIAEAGGLEGLGHSQGEWLELLNISLRATADGELSFTTTPSLNLPMHDILISGQDGGVDPTSVYYGQLSLTISAGEPSTGIEAPPAAISTPESPVISVPFITDAPIIVAISDDSEGGQFAVSVLELLSAEMQAKFANALALNKTNVKNNDSRATLLSSANPGNVGDQSSPPMTNRETDLTVVSRKPNADSTADALANQAVTAKTELSLL